MSRLDEGKSGFISDTVSGDIHNPLIGRVEEVYERSQTSDNSNFEVDVRILGEETQHRAIPYQHTSHGEIHVPRKNDKVLVEYRDGANNPPIARNTVYTNKDRPPIGKAGMWRKFHDAPDSDGGSGDLYIESFTDYDINPASTDPSKGSADSAWARIAKKTSADADADVQIEFFDGSNDSYVTIESTVDGGSDSGVTWGLKLDLSNGTFKLLDSDGYGIVSDGSGNFTWHHKDVDFSQGTTDSL